MPGLSDLLTRAGTAPPPPADAVEEGPPEPRLAGFFKKDAPIRGQLTEVGRQAGSLSRFRSRVNASVGNAVNREARTRGSTASSAVAQRFGDQETGAVTHGDVLNNALRRAKARTGIHARGDNAVRNQQLKDRLTLVRSGVADQNRSLNQSVTGSNIQAGVNVGVQDARQFGQAATADAFGGAAGALAGVLKGNKDNNGKFFDFGKKN